MRKRKASRVSHKTDEQFRLLVTGVEDYGIFMLDPEGRVATWNAGAERIKGYSADEITGQHFSKFYSDEDQAAGIPQRELEVATSQGRVEDEGWRIRKNGSRFWALVTITAMRDEHGKLIGFSKVTRDLTDRKNAEEKLRESQEQFRMLVNGVEEYAIYMLDPKGNVATWNSGAQRIKGYSPKEIIGKNFACFYTADDVSLEVPQYNLEQARLNGHTRCQGLRIRKDGSAFQAEVLLTAMKDESGKIRGFSKVTRDISDQIRARSAEAARAAAEKANEAKDHFLAALSHELRTPLTPALAAASYLAENASKFPSEFSGDVHIIRRNVQLQARLIDDLLDLTRVARGKIELHFDRVDAHDSIRQALDIARSDTTDKELTVVVALHAKKHHIWADPTRIQQVFWNLITNAVKFTPVGGKIEIHTSNDDHNHFAVEVIDTGMGLAISKHLVDLHDGLITVKSRGRSHGAAFKVTLDVVANQVGRSGVPARTPQNPAKSLRILLVEDHGDTRRTLSRLLSHFGHQISVADCTQAALEIVKAKEFDVVLSDIGLPDGSGYEVISHAKQKQHLKGVALTGFGTDEDIRRGREAGFDFHLTKPVDFHELRSVLDQVGA
jgi:PAS domain S-box-containing protein